MKKVLVDDVRIGILDNNGKFVMSTFVDGLKTYFQVLQPESLEYTSKTEISGYEILNDDKEMGLKLFSIDGKIYIVRSFSNEYTEYLNRLYFNLEEMISKSKTKYNSSYIGSRILDLSLIVKILGNELFVPPVIGMKIHGYGNILGHKYLKNGFGKTSKVVAIDASACSITSTRTVYDVISLSVEYEKYLIDISSEIAILLKQFTR